MDTRKYAPDCPDCYTRCRAFGWSWVCGKCGQVVAKRSNPRATVRNARAKAEQQLALRSTIDTTKRSWTPAHARAERDPSRQGTFDLGGDDGAG